MLKTNALVIMLVIMLAGCSSVTVKDPDAKHSKLSFDRDIKLLAQLPDEVMETSGLALRDGLIWTINDSGSAALLYALNEQYKLHRTVKVSGAKNLDWEELAQDEEYLYIADCGNNRGYRTELQIYKIHWQDLDSSEQEVRAQRIVFEYADRNGSVDPKNHNYDCEALTSVGDELWLFTKNRKDEKTSLYRLSKNDSFQTVYPSSSYAVDGLITAADFEPGSKYVALLGYEKNVILGSSFIWILPVKGDELMKPDWQLAQRQTLSPYAQWEAIKWDVSEQGTKILFSSEKSPLLDVSIGYINVDLPAIETSTEK